ncbi:uncharacterized protein LOC143265529 [Megachile rotundata]|uniref:uncharacterized protein LOC143265529 n=1 Tax=Megachile rotundata TaxID=143995 RepID=UPI003FD2C92D
MDDRETNEWIVQGLHNMRIREYLGPLAKYKKPGELLRDLMGTDSLFQERPSHRSIKDTKGRSEEKSDLGSSSITLRKDVADEMGFTYLEGSFERLIGYGNGIVNPVGKMTGNLRINNIEAKVTIHIVPSDCQVIPLIVGHPFTEQSHVEIVSRPSQLIIKELDDLHNVTPDDVQKKTVLWAKEAVVIPNNYLGYIAVHTEFRKQDLCIEGGLKESGQLIPRCVICTDDKGESILPVLNVSGGDVKIKEGATLTRGEAVVHNQEDSKREVNTEPVTMEEINTELPEDEAQSIVSILNNFTDLIARNIRQVGCTDKAEMNITLMDGNPIVYRPYRVSRCEQDKIDAIVEELKEANIIEDSDSPFASPVLLVKKKTGDVRMCIDYRALNRKTIKQQYPMPRIDDNLDGLRSMTYFTTLDLSSG